MFNRDVIFTGQGSSRNFYDVLPRKLTLRNPLLPHLHESDMSYHHETVFKEVSINKYSHAPRTQAFLNSKPKVIHTTRELYDTLKNVIERLWDTSKTHIISHSSGYDSRVVSNIIKELGEKNGKEWLGEVICVEVLGEGVPFKKIMDIQGFKGIVYNEGVSIEKHHEYSFNFKNYYKKFNGVTSFPVNMWYDGYTHLEKNGILNSSNVQCFTGYGANETMEIAHKVKGFDYYFRWHHYLQIQNFKLWGENWEHPYWDFEYLNALRGFEEGKKIQIRIAEKMAKEMTPHLNHIPNIFIKLNDFKNIRTVNNDLLQRINNDYNNSWYGKRMPIPIKADFTNYRNWWTHYCIASMCEHLIEEGYEIRI